MPRDLGVAQRCCESTHPHRLRRSWTIRQTTYIVYMRIGEPARRHGITDADMLHAARSAMRRVLMDDDLVMLIGPARDGRMLEIGMLDIDSADPVLIHAMPLRPRLHKLLE